MRSREFRGTVAGALCAVLAACYPSLPPLPDRAPAGDITLPAVREIESRLRSCHALRNALAEQAYDQRRQLYYLRQALAVLAAVGGGMSALLDGRSARMAGGVLALLSASASAVLPPTSEDNEGVQRAAARADAAWNRTNQELESVEGAARAYEAHLRSRPEPVPPGASVGATAEWIERRRRWDEGLKVHRRVLGEHFAALSRELTACTSAAGAPPPEPSAATNRPQALGPATVPRS